MFLNKRVHDMSTGAMTLACKRIQIRCQRRGILELELLYKSFLDRHPPRLMSQSDVLELEAMLSCEDDLGILNRLLGRAQTPKPLSHNKLFEKFAHFVSEKNVSK